jgi:hypothetical protein
MDRIKSGFQTLLQTLTVVLWGSYFSMSLFHKNFYNQVLSCTLSTFLKGKKPLIEKRGGYPNQDVNFEEMRPI